MKILYFDTEHTEGVYHPWEPGFVLSCLSYSMDNITETLWFDHKNIDYESDAKDKSSPPDNWKLVQQLVDSADIVVGHNLKHDIIVAQFCGGIDFNTVKLWDTMVCEYLLSGQDQERNFGLDDLALVYKIPGKLKSAKQYWDLGIHTYDIPYDILKEYSEQDVSLTKKIFEIQYYETENTQIRKVIELQNEFIMSLVDMECNGLKIDVKCAEELYAESKKNADAMEESLKIIFGDRRINLQSNDHLSACLYGGMAVIKYKNWVMKTLKSKPESTYREVEFKEEVVFPKIFEPLSKTETKKKGYYKTDKETILQLKSRNPHSKKIKKLLVDLSSMTKIMETLRGKKNETGMLNKIAHDGCVHTFFNNTFTTTGRLSSSKPNLMNMPREGTSPIKNIFIPRYDKILQWDLSQIEWRNAAWLSQDKVMMNEIEMGIDQHVAACVDLMELPYVDKNDPQSKMNRFFAKVFNFRMIYGGSFWGFYLDPNMPRFTKRKWKTICEDFYKKYCGLEEWQRENIGLTWSNNGLLKIPTGRRFQFHKTDYSDGAHTYPENKIKNYPVQGMSGADILPLACVIIRRGLRNMKMQSRLILTVHDSIVFDCVNEEVTRLVSFLNKIGQLLPAYISNYFEIDFNVPLAGECEVGESYGSMKPITIGEGG